ncbi:UNVERIFIED_ORG: hypothetical protein J2W65_001368 [Pseudomonas parafulva]|jgi:hypothetical protein|uniref:DUF3077 domain-containing protein n=1 Tax=Pseudomonas fulva TaxID=47880 RepID=A0A7S9LDV2_9PSED|nr:MULTISPECIES: hypothetical protein [Pseudomonas]MCY4124778.1 hypothetical protein [Pseudomonas sp.]MDP9555760.1 hypothetical protein [Pseudomonas parafulva]AVF55862.1 hypothetical protein AL527_12160 [Pseudomonas fulva]MBA1208071.1 hypothetical protein [Pseudomonas fulva]MBA1216621.1 hypothetical protein [Pseudomonas fulva]
MLKIVPDPPLHSGSLEDILVQATEYATCAAAVVQQAMSLGFRSPASVLMLTSLHELETLKALLESAVTHVQMRPKHPICH